MPHQSGAQFLADSLHAYGVTHVFFVPAILSHTLAELDRRTPIKRILTHGEKAAVYMADGYARASGRAGICFAQCIGAANLVAGLRDPFLACSPLVVFTGGPDAQSRGRHAYQEIEDFPLFKPVTKFSARVNAVTRVPDMLRQAFRAATTGTPGPAHLELAGHMGDLEQETADLELIAEPAFGRVPALRIAPELQAVRAAAQLLCAADRPIIVAGGGARTSNAGAELRELAERLAIPVATSLNGKDLIPGDHPLAVGVVGTYSRASANRSVLAADLVFYVGSQTGSQVSARWRVPKPGTPVIQLDINPAELGRHYPNRVSLWGDAKLGLRSLIAASDAGSAGRRRAWIDQIHMLAREWRESIARQAESNAVPIRPERICRELSRHLPADALVVSETGHAGMWSGAILDLNQPGSSYIRAAGSLGWGLPAAPRCQAGGSRPARDPVLRRRRLLVPPCRAGDGRPVEHRRRAPGEQQPCAEHGDRYLQSRVRWTTGAKPCRALAVWRREPCRRGRNDGRQGHRRGEAGRDRPRARAGVCGQAALRHRGQE